MCGGEGTIKMLLHYQLGNGFCITYKGVVFSPRFSVNHLRLTLCSSKYSTMIRKPEKQDSPLLLLFLLLILYCSPFSYFYSHSSWLSTITTVAYSMVVAKSMDSRVRQPGFKPCFHQLQGGHSSSLTSLNLRVPLCKMHLVIVPAL